MRSARFGSEHVLVFEPGEPLIETFTSYLAEQHVSAGRFWALGGFAQAQIKYWNAQTKQYEQREVSQQVEVVSLLGSVSRKQDQPYIHAHVTLGTSDYTPLAGHLGEGTVYPTLEVFLTQINGTLERQHDQQTGLDLLHPVPDGLT